MDGFDYDAYSNTHSEANTYSNTHSDANTYSNSHSYYDAYYNTHPDAYSDTHSNSTPMLVPKLVVSLDSLMSKIGFSFFVATCLFPSNVTSIPLNKVYIR